MYQYLKAHVSGIPQGNSLVGRAGQKRVAEWKEFNGVDRVCMATESIATPQTVTQSLGEKCSSELEGTIIIIIIIIRNSK